LGEEMARRGQIGSSRNPFPVVWLYQFLHVKRNWALAVLNPKDLVLEKRGFVLVMTD
jgi:hypothetical protein